MTGIVIELPDETLEALDKMGKAEAKAGAGSGTPRQRAKRLAAAAVVALAKASGDPELFAVRFVEAREALRREDLKAKRQLLLDGVAEIDGVLDASGPTEDGDQVYVVAGARAADFEERILDFKAGNLVRYGEGSTVAVKVVMVDPDRERPYYLDLAGEPAWCATSDVHALPDEETG